MRDAVAELVAALPDTVRVGVIGGAGGSLSAPDGPRVVDLPSFTEEYKPEALEAIGILEDLEATPATRDFFYIHPAGWLRRVEPGRAHRLVP